MGAALSGHIECVKILLNAGAKVNAQNKFGYTALIQAAYEGHVECVKILLNAGAEVNAQTRVHGFTALKLAADKGQVESVKILACPWNLVEVRERINVVRALLRDRLGAGNNHLHAKILLSAKELKENIILVLLGEIDAGKEEVFLDPVFYLVKKYALKSLSKQLKICKEIQSDSEVQDEVKSLCNPDDIEKMKERISEYEAHVKYKSNENEKEFSDAE